MHDGPIVQNERPTLWRDVHFLLVGGSAPKPKRTGATAPVLLSFSTRFLFLQDLEQVLKLRIGYCTFLRAGRCGKALFYAVKVPNSANIRPRLRKSKYGLPKRQCKNPGKMV